MEHQILYVETRGGLEENRHTGSIAVVDLSGRIKARAGDPHRISFYRSASKPLQALPTLSRQLDRRYDLSEKQVALFAASHLGDPVHLQAVDAILEKAGFSEEDLILNPDTGRAGIHRKGAHTCSGKHLSLMLLARELSGDHKDYWRPDCAAQQEVLRTISLLSDTPADQISLGTDGCGVPVFAVSLRSMALSFLRFSHPELIGDPSLSAAAQRLGQAISHHPQMIRGEGTVDTILNTDPNLIAKSGKFGVYCIGMRKEGLAVALKIDDGDDGHLPILIRGILEQLGYRNPALMEQLKALMPSTIVNDLGNAVGEIELSFHL